MKTVVVAILFLYSTCLSQDTSRVDESTTEENIALITMTGIIIPLAIAGTVISAVPPSVSLVFKNGVTYTGLNFESGFGVGEKRETGVFSDWRLGLSYSYIINSKVRDIFRIELKRDVHFEFIDRRKIFLSGVHISGGMMTDFPNHGYTLGTGLWIKSPWLSFFGFMPQHTYGITYRYNKYFHKGKFSEISLGVTSAFTF